MNWIDYIIIGVLVVSALISLLRGFVKEALSLLIWFSAFFVASQFFLPLSSFFSGIEDTVVRNGVAIIVLFICTLLIGSIVNHVIGQFIHKAGLSNFDRILGVVFGAVRGVLIVAAGLFFIDAFTSYPKTADWKHSVLIPHFGVIIEWFFNYLERSSSFLLNNIN